MEPAKSIVELLGGPSAVALSLRLTTGGVAQWYRPSEKGGCDGLVPSHRIPALVRLARTQNKFLEPNMFFEGHL